MTERFPITLALHLLLNAPEPDLDAIYREVATITADVRTPTTPISSSLTNTGQIIGAANVNVHGTRYFAGRSAHFVMEQGRHIESAAMDYSGPEYERGWEVRSGLWHADGTTYNGMPGYIEWTRLD